jgi:hypothetical protein
VERPKFLAHFDSSLTKKSCQTIDPEGSAIYKSTRVVAIISPPCMQDTTHGPEKSTTGA